MFRITYVLGGEESYRQKAMRVLLAALTRVNRVYFAAHPEAPPITEIRYEEEPEGQDDWCDASAVLRMDKLGQGVDGEDAACYAAGWIQARYGVLAWPQLVTKGGCTHVVVEMPDGRQIDPTLFMKDAREPSASYACTAHHKDEPEERITVVTDLFRSDDRVGLRGTGSLAQDVTHECLARLLHALFIIDMIWLRRHPETPGIYQAGVHYEEEPPGREDWQDIPSTIRRGNGDCEDLAAWCAAQRRVRQSLKAFPSFIWRRRPSGAYLYHIQTTYPDVLTGKPVVEDPSRVLGMGSHHLSH